MNSHLPFRNKVNLKKVGSWQLIGHLYNFPHFVGIGTQNYSSNKITKTWIQIYCQYQILLNTSQTPMVVKSKSMWHKSKKVIKFTTIDRSNFEKMLFRRSFCAKLQSWHEKILKLKLFAVLFSIDIVISKKRFVLIPLLRRHCQLKIRC